jgi:hypothetical protein
VREGPSPVLSPAQPAREPLPRLPYLLSGLPYLNATHPDAIAQLDGADDSDLLSPATSQPASQFQIPDPAAEMAAAGAVAPELHEVRQPGVSGIAAMLAEYQEHFATLEKGDLTAEYRAQLTARCEELTIAVVTPGSFT